MVNWGTVLNLTVPSLTVCFVDGVIQYCVMEDFKGQNYKQTSVKEPVPTKENIIAFHISFKNIRKI